MFFVSFSHLFLILRCLRFCLNFLVRQKNGLIRSLSLIPIFKTSQTGRPIITVQIWLNISRTKGNQFVQVIECNVRNIFLQKSCTKRRRETRFKNLSHILYLRIRILYERRNEQMNFYIKMPISHFALIPSQLKGMLQKLILCSA